MTKSPAAQLEILKRGTAQIISEERLASKLEGGVPMRVKLGVDPTAPDIHLGHTVALEKLRQFQELGHQVVLIIGDFTATVGDPSGRSATRPQLTRDEVLENARTYTDQAFCILDRQATEVVYNGDWFRNMTYEDVLRLNSRVTMQQMLQREDFRNRIEKEEEIRLHEIQYPVMQGWDSVEVRADVEIGGTDQLFNILVGRDMQKSEGMPRQVAVLVPILEGTDGVRKMSKSYGNYIGVSESAGGMFGKAMSISDGLMSRWHLLLLGEELDSGVHPMEAKKELACRIVARYHNESEAAAARENWEAQFSRRDLDSAELPEFLPSGEAGATVAIVSQAYAECFQQKRSNSEIRRLVEQGSVQINGEKIQDPKATPRLLPGDILRLDKKHTVRIREADESHAS